MLFWRGIVFMSPAKVFIYKNRSSFFFIDLIGFCDLYRGTIRVLKLKVCYTIDSSAVYDVDQYQIPIHSYQQIHLLSG